MSGVIKTQGQKQNRQIPNSDRMSAQKSGVAKGSGIAKGNRTVPYGSKRK